MRTPHLIIQEHRSDALCEQRISLLDIANRQEIALLLSILL